MEYAMEHSVSRTVVASECSPPPMCGLGRSEGFWRIACRSGASTTFGVVHRLARFGTDRAHFTEPRTCAHRLLIAAHKAAW